MRNSMKGPDSGPTGASAKLTKNPSYDGKLEEVKDEAKAKKKLADVVRGSPPQNTTTP